MFQLIIILAYFSGVIYNLYSFLGDEVIKEVRKDPADDMVKCLSLFIIVFSSWFVWIKNLKF